ncbi:MAG TPA: outer membrane lipoprotein chaperone LolA [Burkholderiales bacterium]|nr:outer membrane lipoprotein chaperone LolA [Burkholderiales bacterium]
MKKLLLLLVTLGATSVYAGSLEQLKSFLTGSKTLKANFEQTVKDKGGKVIQQSSGSMQFSRPGKFRWQYAKPYQQLVVGDGEKLWLYDPDLNQVTVRKLDKAIGSSPAALLAGDAEIEKNFNLKDAGSANNLNWVEATPKSPDSTFEHVRMGFAGNELTVLELKDNFGQNTVIRLADVKVNGKFSSGDFTFSPPKGADVISD